MGNTHHDPQAVCGAPSPSSSNSSSVHIHCAWRSPADSFTITVTTPSCCQNSSTTSTLLLDQEGEDVIELNVC